MFTFSTVAGALARPINKPAPFVSPPAIVVASAFALKIALEPAISPRPADFIKLRLSSKISRGVISEAWILLGFVTDLLVIIIIWRLYCVGT